VIQSRPIDYTERSRLPSVNRRSFERRGDVGEADSVGEFFPESVLLEADDDRRLVSARMSSRLTLRSEDVGATDVSSNSVNLEAVMMEFEVFDVGIEYRGDGSSSV